MIPVTIKPTPVDGDVAIGVQVKLRLNGSQRGQQH